MSSGINVNYGDGTFEGVDDRVYYAGVKDLSVAYKGFSLSCDYIADGAAKVNEATEEEYQFVVWYDKGDLKKDR